MNIFRVNPVNVSFTPSDVRFVNNAPPVYADPDTESFIKNGFAGNASVFTIVTKAAKKFGHINRGVYKINDAASFKKYNNLARAGLSTKEAMMQANRYRKKAYNNDETVPGALNDLIQRPNWKQGQDTFFMLADIMYKLTGECFIWLNRGDVDDQLDDNVVKKMPVLDMWVLPSNLVEIIPDLNDPWDVKGYWFDIYGTRGSRQFIRKCDIIHWAMPNPQFDGGQSRSHLRGLSPFKAGNKILTQDDDTTDASVAMAQNGGAKAIVFDKGLAKMTPTQETQLRDVLDRKVNNKNMKAAVAAVQGDWGMLDLGLSSVDMELVKWSQETFVKICNLLDVPPALFLVDQTYENKSASIKDWLTNSVIPDACSLRDEMNRVLLPAFGATGVMIDNDISDIPELQEDMGKLVQWMNLFPWMTPNQKLEYLGEEASTEDGMDAVWIPNNLVKLSDAGMPDVVPGSDQNSLNDYQSVIKPSKNGVNA